MSNKLHKDILDKTEMANLGETPVLQFMNEHVIMLKANYTLKSTIETFRVHHISGAPVVDYQNKIIGVISEYDLLIQASSRSLSDPIKFNSKIIGVYPETTLKDVLVILYKQKLKWMPVINKENYVQGVVSRIDVLNFIATHSAH
jgi:predicted transcriptional regulator